MFKSDFEKFVFKKSIIIFFILTIINMLFLENKQINILGLILGSIISILKFDITYLNISNFISNNNKFIKIKAILNYSFLQLITVIILILSVKVNIVFFLCVGEGILIVMFSLFINVVTELLGISKNNFCIKR